MMSQLSVSLIVGIAFSLLHILAVIISLKYIKKIAPVLLHAASALISLILLCLSYAMTEFAFWIALSVLAFCTSFYLFVFGAIYKSLTLRMLCASQSLNGSMTIEQLENIVTLPTFTTRISLLQEMGKVAVENERYSLTQKGKKTAHFFNVIRRIFRVDTKAIYEPIQIKDHL